MDKYTSPTVAQLYLAFRQAKVALFYERRGLGLQNLARFEAQLSSNLKQLESRLLDHSWFDNVELGDVWLAPKRIRTEPKRTAGLIQIGVAERNLARAIDVQLRLSPSPEFAIVEVLFLWKFCGFLDQQLSDNVLGYRLDLKNNRIPTHRRWLFEYWPTKYEEFRTQPLVAAKNALRQGRDVLIFSGDLASYYDTIEPSFIKGPRVLAGMEANGADGQLLEEYERAVASLLRAYDRFRVDASGKLGLPLRIGLPIGSLTSRVVANLALSPLDAHVENSSGIYCYRRYVDDLAIVAEAQNDKELTEVAGRLLPLRIGDGAALWLDAEAMDRRGSEFCLQTDKVRVHQLSGIPGIDFVDAITADFESAVSERRAFVDSATLLDDAVSKLIRAGESEGSRLRVLRDAERTSLQRFRLSTSLQSLDRVSSLIAQDNARSLIRNMLERIGRVLDSEDNWIEDLNVSFRLLKLAVLVGDWESSSELIARMDKSWGSLDSLRSTASELYYRGQLIDPRRQRPWVWLRNYLHERRLEAVCSVLPVGSKAKEIRAFIKGGLGLRSGTIGAIAIRRRAQLLFASDLRAKDREDDSPANHHTRHMDRRWLMDILESDPDLAARLKLIDSFVGRCEELGDEPWLMPAARLFLCTRPPTYFDIARRWLHRVDIEGFSSSVFSELLELVNAVRGTDYRDEVGEVLDSHTVSIRPLRQDSNGAMAYPRNPNVILGNLTVSDNAWNAAATRTSMSPYNAPNLSLDRFKSVATVLDKATRVAAKGRDTILVLPELSLPRKWFRSVANHVVKYGRYSLITGLEYQHDPRQPYVRNQVYAVLAGPFGSVATWPWTKRLPATEEKRQLASLKPAISFPPPSKPTRARTVVTSPWGSFSVLVCSELIEARRVADLLGRVDLVVCPAWNRDTSSYDHLIQSVGFQLHSVIAIANNGQYSDCRAWAPRKVRWQRDLCRLIERGVDDVVQVEVPLIEMLSFRDGDNDDWRPLPPDWP